MTGIRLITIDSPKDATLPVGDIKEARIRYYQARAAKGLPLFTRGGPVRRVKDITRCWCCGVVIKGIGGGRKPADTKPGPVGYISRRFSASFTEAYCLPCWATWGWVDGPAHHTGEVSA